MGNYKDDLSKKVIKSNAQFSLYPMEPLDLYMEPTTICNHGCLFCAYKTAYGKMKRKKTKLDINLAKRVIKEASEMNVHKLGLAMRGEPFIHERLADIVAYAKEINIPYVFITTNGTVCSEDDLKNVFDAGLDSIKFSINAGSPETYKITHGVDDYEKAYRNLIFSFNYRKSKGLSFRILSGFVVTKHTKNELESHYNKIKDYVDDILFMSPANNSGSLVEEIEDLRVDLDEYGACIDEKHLFNFTDAISIPCPLPFNTMGVTAEGYLMACCSDNEGFLIVEDLNKMSLKDAWFSPRMVEFRKMHMDNKLDGTACFNCAHKKTTKVKPLNDALFKACH